MHNEGGQGRKSVATDSLVQRVDEMVGENRRFTLSDLFVKFAEVLRLFLYSIVTEQLSYKKVCARWVPNVLPNNHKTWLTASG